MLCNSNSCTPAISLLMDLTGFLFGNVNEEGELEDESLLDKESVAQLSRMGVGSVLGEIVNADEVREDGAAGGYDSDDNDDEHVKSPTALDFADIAEVAAEEEEGDRSKALHADHEHLLQKGLSFALSQVAGTSSGSQSWRDDDEDYDDSGVSTMASGSQLSSSSSSVPTSSSISSATPSTLTTPFGAPETVSASLNSPSTASLDMTMDWAPSQPQDTAPLPLTSSCQQPSGAQVRIIVSQPPDEGDQQQVMPPQGANVPPIAMAPPSLDKPPPISVDVASAVALPALLPEDMSLETLYAKVRSFFPTFKPNCILRFSSLLGLGKPSSRPKVWRGAKKPKHKKGDRPGEPKELKLDFDSKPPPPNICFLDNEDKFVAYPMSDAQAAGNGPSLERSHLPDPETSEWRFGPARVWYDLMGVPEDGQGFSYGYKMKANTPESEDEGKPPSMDGGIAPYVPPDEAFLMVIQDSWENRILWDVPYTPGPLSSGMGGSWSSGESSAGGAVKPPNPGPQQQQPPGAEHPDIAYSMFPVENYELVHSRWEDDVIWDSEAVSHLPKPSVVRFDPNDPNFILGVPEEPASATSTEVAKDGKKDIKKVSKIWASKLGKSESQQSPASMLLKKDMFNLSNDDYYNPKHVSSSSTTSGFDSSVVQHSIPALELYQPWFPTYWTMNTLRNYHRPKLNTKLRCEPGKKSTGYYHLSNLVQNIIRKDKEREKERISSGGGEVFFMRTPMDLSACDGHLILCEYSEQHPSLVMCTGMATKIKNYYRRPERQGKCHAPQLEYGETTYVQNLTHFLGNVRPGQTLQSFENNLFRAPVYAHVVPDTDFLVIASGDQLNIRDVRTIFVVGQECPKVEVPAPNSKAATQTQKELLQVHIFRLFQESDDSPRRIKMDSIRKLFPPVAMSESVIRKVLKLSADFKREGYETGYWYLRHDFRLPSEDELRAMLSPDQYCAYTGMLAAEQRLKDAGYRSKSLFSVEEDDEEYTQKIDDEVRGAPWNTTHHFINAMKGKYQLSVTGPVDPTGCGEGFSYTRLNTRKDTNSGLPQNKRYKAVMGTDGDLRKLKLSKARNVLRGFGVPEEEINRLSRWQVIDMVRTISTEAAKSGDGAGLKFARGARFSQMEAQEKYKEECQRVFDLQNRVLVSTEPLSTDEDSDSSGESDDELGKNLESLLVSKKTSAQLSHEQEEAEREELKKLLSEDKPVVKPVETPTELSNKDSSLMDADDGASLMSFSSMAGRRLVISRTFRDEEGREYVRDEVVKDQAVIDAYVYTKKRGITTQLADQDQQTRDEMKKEKRRLQDQLRRLKKVEEKAKKKAVKPRKEKPLTTINMCCSACGQRGHMKTNKNCPMYKNNPVNVALTDQELAQHESSIGQDDLVKVEGTKVLLNRVVVDHANDVRRKSLLLRFPKDKVRKKRRHGEEECDYLEKRKSIQRRKTNPQVPFADALEKVVNKLAVVPEAWAFLKPVQAKIVPDYYNVIKFPMDLQTVRDNVRKHEYISRQQFMEHINLIVNNCITYNGFNSDLTKNAQRMLEICVAEMKEVDKELEQLEQEINPILGDDPQVALSYLFGKVVEEMKATPDSWPFHTPVSAKKLPDYYKIIRRPMDLDSMHKNCKKHKYRCREEFIADINQVVENSITYNGPSSPYTRTAETMRILGLQALESVSDNISKLEEQVPKVPLALRQESLGGTPYDGSQPLSVDSDAMVLESGQAASPLGDIDVEGWEEESVVEDVVDVKKALLEDLQHSSTSESDSESDLDDNRFL